MTHIFMRKLGQPPREITYDLNYVVGELDKRHFRWYKDKLAILFDIEIPILNKEVFPEVYLRKERDKNYEEQFKLKFTRKQLIELKKMIDYKLKTYRSNSRKNKNTQIFIA